MFKSLKNKLATTINDQVQQYHRLICVLTSTDYCRLQIVTDNVGVVLPEETTSATASSVNADSPAKSGKSSRVDHRHQ